jgi:uncharacterized protein (TIGR03000 family)
MRKLLRTLAATAILASAAVLMGPCAVWAQHGGGHGGGGHGGGGHASGGHAGGGFGGHAGGGFSSGARPGGFSAGVHPSGAASVYHSGATHVGGVGAYNHNYGQNYSYGHNYGAYRPYYGSYGRGYGYYRPYYGYGAYLPFAFGLGYYSNYYSPLDYGAAYYASSSYPQISAYGSDNIPLTSDPQAANPSSADRPPSDDLAHLQLTVPENATVLIDGTATTQTGSVREFVTPALAPGSRYSYKIAVRYTDAQGKAVEDARDISFRANDWFSIDFTRPQPQQQVPANPLLPKSAKEE